MATVVLSPEEDQARLVLRKLMALRELTSAEMSRRAGYNAQTMWDKAQGRSRVGLSDIARFAEVLNVEPLVFLMTPDEAVRWTLDHPASSNDGCSRTMLSGAHAPATLVRHRGSRVDRRRPRSGRSEWQRRPTLT